ncbi:hypothetical protein BLA29_014105 [Euroglyphus maynei]|uniref:Uncharacterized protein n=1 Tax=Euroglyphus maynei TaxID=6958 RepID=A0A1Y3BGJ5_EURMA|nr:hypothetical protein BLA29_014105 [Euroglyphus maynei]
MILAIHLLYHQMYRVHMMDNSVSYVIR